SFLPYQYAIWRRASLVKTAKRRFFATLHGVMMKKEAVEKFFAFSPCHFGITPYNAPPLTRNNGLHAAGSAEKSENKCLTLNEENVIYGTSRQSAKARRNCSLTIYQTICVGTRRYGFLTSQDEK
ncbi:hypothetical protein PDR34_27060, partial [Bacillus cereus]|nr:hypothetical protein [Bacillus cereus]